MAFTAESFKLKLSKLNESTESIQTLSHWVQYHKKACVDSAAVWAAETKALPPSRQLLYVYLANDIMQNSRRKGPDLSRPTARSASTSSRRLRGADGGYTDKARRCSAFGRSGTCCHRRAERAARCSATAAGPPPSSISHASGARKPAAPAACSDDDDEYARDPPAAAAARGGERREQRECGSAAAGGAMPLSAS